MEIVLCNSLDDAVIAYTAKRWNEVSNIALGRTIMQKVCYFLKSKGIPLDFTFDMYNYGPFSSELYYKMDELEVDSIISDVSLDSTKSVYKPGPMIDKLIGDFQENIDELKEGIDEVIALFSGLNTNEMELLATIHYFQISMTRFYKEPPQKKEVINAVIKAKREKFNRQVIDEAYDELFNIGLFNWQTEGENLN